jgi:hypothetical protein
MRFGFTPTGWGLLAHDGGLVDATLGRNLLTGDLLQGSGFRANFDRKREFLGPLVAVRCS